jgi:hypothetical protein
MPHAFHRGTGEIDAAERAATQRVDDRLGDREHESFARRRCGLGGGLGRECAQLGRWKPALGNQS